MKVAMRRLDTAAADFEAEFARLRHGSAQTDSGIEHAVTDILDDVRRRGDAAVREYTQRFDGFGADGVALELPRAAWREALVTLAPARRAALEAAAARVRSFHERQLDACGRSWSYRDEAGTLLGQKVTPLDRVGIYVPGGKAAYPSSVLMNAIPAQVACAPPIVSKRSTPHSAAAASTSGFASPPGVGTAITISPTPATWAGIAFISTLDG